jgi:23S rRNA pseudouridine2605 synthase
MTLIRLQRAIAQAGLASRRAAEEMIRQGRVIVNGHVVQELGTRVDLKHDTVLVDRKPLSAISKKIYLLLYKPSNYVTTTRDPHGRKTVLDIIEKTPIRLFPVGRLDYDAEGLIVLTNDGDLAHRLQHPRFGVLKTYQVKVKGHPQEPALNALRTGVRLDEGRTAAAEVDVIRTLPQSSWLKMVLHQGWYRQIKRMCEAVGHRVLKIRRIGYGPLQIGQLTPGGYRHLTRAEIRQLYRLVQLEESELKRDG